MLLLKVYQVLCGTQEVCEKGRGAYCAKAAFALALLVLTAIDLTHSLKAVAQIFSQQQSCAKEELHK